MTDAELITLLRAELDVAMQALRKYADGDNWLHGGLYGVAAADQELWPFSNAPAKKALVDIERMEAEAGRAQEQGG